MNPQREFNFQCGAVTYYINSSRMSAGKGKGNKKRYWLSMVQGNAVKKVVIGGSVLQRVLALPMEEIKTFLDDTIALATATNPNRVRIVVREEA